MTHLPRVVLACLILQTAHGAEYALPAANQGHWEPGVDVGVTGGIAQYLAGGVNDRATTGTVIDVTQAPYSADNTGVLDVKAAVASARAAASPGDVIYFPAGTYLFATGFIYSQYKDDITIRGAGVGVTTFHCSTTQPIFVFSVPGTLTQSDSKTVSGTKTKGTTVLTVPDTTNYSAGMLAVVRVENEEDNTRIIAGTAPVWSSRGYPFVRQQTVRVAAVTSTTLTIEPPLLFDATNLELQIAKPPNGNRTEGWGFEDFSVTFDSADHPTQFIVMTVGYNCWAHNLFFENWSRQTASGSCIKIGDSKNIEVRKCRMHAEEAAFGAADGAIEFVTSSCLLIEDNIIEGSFDPWCVDSGNSSNSVLSFNYTENNKSILHNAHPSHLLFEGNVSKAHHSDGYHGSGSHNTLFRNWFTDANSVILNRFRRNYALAGNVYGEDGAKNGAISWGNPNIGSGVAHGFAGPTGLSDRAGTADYIQVGYGVYEYIIQGSDISEGDFWADWKITGTLTTRTSDTTGVFAMSGGVWATGLVPAAVGELYVSIWWDSKGSSMHTGDVTDVDGLNITITWPSGVLPAESTVVQVYMFASGYQERDLDVEVSTEQAHNYYSLSSGTGSVQDSISPDTLPNSLAYSAEPSWWGDDGFAGAWPPVNPDSPTFSLSIIPAGARYLEAIAPGNLTTDTITIGP